MKIIKTKSGHEIIVDDEDFHYLSRFNWRVIKQKRKATEINPSAEYTSVVRTVNHRTVAMQYFILPLDVQTVLFKNGNRFDFRKENLKPIHKNILINTHRKSYGKKNSKFRSKYKGVTHRVDNKHNPWQARITAHDKRVNLGFFETEKEAGIAYNEKSKELYGELAYQNKIDD
ncbi:MAG: hypothetical protein KAS32_00195 [Candidatus Peribacteraceae bacterium]|nr:hypothetical protein [Candidatus Peribacteraceae bacterium]